ncbi:Ragulator complex protein LAMTOR4 [Mizuhopecten yessoensis]|uniref:Late endosomal/lysosomal adaptor and MAPK and MTOR activator 4 n=1 Tax=Mizuhopecten yessoensis TaxID=6573 RepID=A0A210PVD2_MIZYE|nr:Ragulator complex protein LAMTOR4 [Mizuhopecten yessoensis]
MDARPIELYGRQPSTQSSSATFLPSKFFTSEDTTIYNPGSDRFTSDIFTMTNALGIDKIQDSLGYLVLTDDGAVLSSGGELQNAESIAEKMTKLVYTAAKLQVSSDKREVFKRISVIWDSFMYVVTVANHRIYELVTK